MLTDLTLTPIAETLWKLASKRASGDLQVRSGKIAKTVFLDHGRIVFAASNLKKDRLGEALIALGRITGEQFERASALMKGDRRRRFGEALVHAGVMDKAELGRSVARQVRRIVASLFEYTEGLAIFEERRCVIPLEYMVSLSAHHLLFDGIRRMKSQPLVLAGVGNLDRRVTLAAVSPFPFDPDDCDALESQILEDARRPVTLRRLAWVPGGLKLERLRAVYALLRGGLLQEAETAQGGAQPPVQMETGTFLLSALQRKPDITSREAIRQEVDEELERSTHVDRAAWLRVSSRAPREELVKALEEKLERYHALLDAVGDDAELGTDIEVILGRVSGMIRLARQPSPTAPTPEPTPERAPVPAPAPAPETPKPAATESIPAPGGFEGSARVELLLMEGQVRMQVADYANAVRVFARLVDLAPDVPAHYLRLAVAMACNPATRKAAERAFHEAVRLDPNNADLHYQFGQYYQGMRVHSRAISEFRAAVAIDPRHKLARQELEALSPKDSALTSLKKLFR